MKRSRFVMMAMIFLAGTALSVPAADLSPVELLGKALFFDMSLSANGKMSCATCHAPETGFTGPDSNINLEIAIYPGTIEKRFGNRKPPTAAYGGDSPVLYYDESEGLWIGGMFWDGKATGGTLGDPLAEQAQGPFLNPLEQALPSAQQVCIRVANSDYADLYETVYGKPVDFKNNVAETYANIARAIAAYERSEEVNPYTSKYDYYLNGEVTLTPKESFGLELFEGKGMCSACHISEPGPEGEPPLFTDYTYDNLGTPKNPNNPFYHMPPKWNPDGQDWVDYGLGGFLMAAGYPEETYGPEMGKQKVPTLRNVDKRPYPEFVKAYMHNGVFTSLKEVVHFYNTRDVDEAGWPPPEVGENVNTDELGNLGLTDEEENAIVAFLKALSDGYVPEE